MQRFIALLFLFLQPLADASACFILYLNDGKRVLVGNHEDWPARDAAIRIRSAQPGRFGSITFTFASEGWPQGGVNEYGLFFDAAQTPAQEMNQHGKESFQGYIWWEVLEKCKTVEEALTLLQKYALPELSQAHILLADATGHAARIGVKNGELAIERIGVGWMMQTNFNTWQPELGDEPICHRYHYGSESLKNHAESTTDNILQILEHTHQDSLTAYSNLYDLTAGTITIYDKLDFRHGRTMRISEVIKEGDCLRRLHEWVHDDSRDCIELATSIVSGKVINSETGEPLQYANVGIEGRNIGTLTDPDGSFTLDIPEDLTSSQISFSYVGFDTQRIPAVRPPSGNPVIRLRPNSRMLQEVVVKARRIDRRTRLGWMGGRDGVLPLDSMTGGAAVALLVKLPATPAVVEKLQVRLMYNSHDTVRLRLHFYDFDTVHQRPGKELLSREVILRDQKRFGWMRFDLEAYNIELEGELVCVGFEWIENRDSRIRMIRGLANWEAWKKQQFEAGDQRAKKSMKPDGTIGYEYHGNMMNWPGFRDLPPFTGLMIEKGKQEKTKDLRTFVRKTSFGVWTEIPSTLNAVVTLSSAKP